MDSFPKTFVLYFVHADGSREMYRAHFGTCERDARIYAAERMRAALSYKQCVGGVLTLGGRDRFTFNADSCAWEAIAA